MRGQPGHLLVAAVTVGALCCLSQASAQPSPLHRSCPKLARHTAKSHEPDAATRLVPSGASAVLLCRYHGLNPPDRHQHLDRDRLVTKARTVRTLIRDLNRSKPFPVLTTCPRDDDSKAVAFFRYADGREIPIRVGLAGCGRVSNGSLALRGDPNALGLIQRLVPR